MIYCNNLKKGDRVMHAVKKRFATISAQPRETSVLVQVIWDGTKAVQSAPVMDLRLIVDGRPEDVPPVDGEPPGFKPKALLPRPRPPFVAPAPIEDNDVEVGSTTSGRIFIGIHNGGLKATVSVIIDREQARRVYDRLGSLLLVK